MEFTSSVGFGDVDNDGDLDLVCGNNGSVTVRLNSGGTFADAGTQIVREMGDNVFALGDVDGDGDLDVVVGSSGGKTMLCRNIGSQFVPAWTRTGDPTFSVALGDVDGDGALDLVRGGPTTTLHLGTGGMFADAAAWTGSTGDNHCIALGDVDRDGDIDLACGGYQTALYLNTGGNFASQPTWTGSTVPPRSLVLGDVDGDGALDLASSYLSVAARLELNVGDGFAATPTWSGYLARGVALGDVDGDGAIDLVVGATVTALLLNNGSTFGSAAWSVMRAAYGVALGDVDGDGDLDLAHASSQTASLYRNSSPSLAATPAWRGPAEQTTSVALGDVDDDGDLDLVRGNASQGDPRSATLYLNTDGRYAATPAWTGPAEPTMSVVLGDVDGDGDCDLVRGNQDAGTTLYLNAGGTFAPVPAWTGDVAQTWSVALGDVDGDGDFDLVRGNAPGRVTLTLNDRGTFADTTIWQGPQESARGVALGDIDGDRTPDLVVGNYSGESRLFLNTGGKFGLEPHWSGRHEWTWSVVLGDVDGDGDVDLVRGNFNVGPTLYRNTGGTLATTPAWEGPQAWNKGVALGDMDGDGDLDLVGGGSGLTLFPNIGGTFATVSNWQANGDAPSVAVGDVDGDGDLDLLGGGDDARLFLNKSPWIKDGIAAMHLANNDAHLRWVRAAPVDSSRYAITFAGVDAESDPLWIIGEYQLEGAPIWYDMDLAGSSRAGPFATSPSGIRQTVPWDVTQLPFHRGNIVIRLRALSLPRLAGATQYVPSYLANVGRITPVRPALAVAPETLVYPTLTVGDSALAKLQISNPGNLDLVIDQIESPHAEVHVDAELPLLVAPGQTLSIDLLLAPTVPIVGLDPVRIHANDPTRPMMEIPVVTDVRALEVVSDLVTALPELPLGEAASVIVTPAPRVHVEKGFLHYRGHAPGVAFSDSVALVPRGAGFIALVPGEDVSEAGLEYYVRVENSGVFGTDPPGAPGSTFFHPVAAPAGISSAAQADASGDFPIGRPTPIEVSMPEGSIFQSGILYYRPGGAAPYDSLDLVLTEVTTGVFSPAATIPGAAVGPRGLEYRVRVLMLTRPLTDPPCANCARVVRTSVSNLEEGVSHPGRRFRLLSVPVELGSRRALDALLTDEGEFGAYDPVRWRLFRYVRETHTNIEFAVGSEAFDVEPGRAFWLINRDGHRIDTSPVDALSTPTGVSFPIVLGSGWNQIGNPFAFPVAWEAVQVPAGVGSLTAFDPGLGTIGDFVDAAGILQPFAGYFVHNSSAEAETLWVPPLESLHAVPAKSMPHTMTLDAWCVRLQAKTGEAFDGANAFGVDPGATDGEDEFDRVEPPSAPGPWVRIAFVHGDEANGYRCDMRAAGKDGDIWELEVRSAQESEPVTLTLRPDQELPAELVFRLVDREQGVSQVLLRPGGEPSSYEIVSYGPDRPYRMAVLGGTADFLEREDGLLVELPTRLVLEHGVNPFHVATSIRFGLPHADAATLAIYNVRGERVAVLRDGGALPAGYHMALWKGTDATGRPAASGVYFCRLEAGSTSLTRRLVLLR